MDIKPDDYGTFDQGGNLSEWNDAIISSSFCGMRAAWCGPFGGSSEVVLRSSRRDFLNPAGENFNDIGFHVSSLAAIIPEPGHAGLLTSASTLWIAVMLKGRPPAGGQVAPFKL